MRKTNHVILDSESDDEPLAKKGTLSETERQALKAKDEALSNVKRRESASPSKRKRKKMKQVFI